MAAWRNRTELMFFTSQRVPKGAPGRWTETFTSTLRLPSLAQPQTFMRG